MWAVLDAGVDRVGVTPTVTAEPLDMVAVTWPVTVELELHRPSRPGRRVTSTRPLAQWPSLDAAAALNDWPSAWPRGELTGRADEQLAQRRAALDIRLFGQHARGPGGRL